MTGGITHILFDLDDTLFDFHRAEKEALRKTLIHFGVDPTDEILSRYSVINQAQWKLLEQGKLTRAQVKIRRYQLFFEEFSLPFDPTEAAKTYESLLSIGHYFIPGAEQLLENLCKDYNLYIVSNGTTAVQEGRLKSADLSRFVKRVFISEAVGFNKPSREFFDACFAQIPGLTRDRTIIVGDSLSSDIQGGINAGIRTVWFNPKGDVNDSIVQPDFEIRVLEDLYDILTKLA